MKDSFYAAMADTLRPPVLDHDRGSMGVIDLRVPSLRCFRAYHRDGRWSTVLRDGKERWYTDKMMRVEAVALRVGTVGSGYTKTRDIATEARVSPGYVSKMLHRFEAWGVIGVIRTRGRNGKLFIFARSAGDRLDRYAAQAIAWLRQSKLGKMARSLRRGNVSFIHRDGRRVSEPSPEPSNGSGIRNTVMEETFSAMSPFTRAVVHERARLAMEDPDGEAHAAAPLTLDRAWDVYAATWPRERVTTYTGEDLAAALGIDLGKGHGSVKCPAHEDKRASLSWKMTDKLLVHCFAGCTFDEIRKAALSR